MQKLVSVLREPWQPAIVEPWKVVLPHFWDQQGTLPFWNACVLYFYALATTAYAEATLWAVCVLGMFRHWSRF